MNQNSAPARVQRHIYWQLVYPGDVIIDEPGADTSIRNRPKGQVLRLRLTVEDTDPVILRTPFMEFAPKDPTGGYVPIFYRKRSSNIASTDVRTDAVVAGWGREGRDSVLRCPSCRGTGKAPGIAAKRSPCTTCNGVGKLGQREHDIQLWAMIDGQLVDCPHHLIEPNTIEMLIEGHR